MNSLKASLVASLKVKVNKTLSVEVQGQQSRLSTARVAVISLAVVAAAPSDLTRAIAGQFIQKTAIGGFFMDYLSAA